MLRHFDYDDKLNLFNVFMFTVANMGEQTVHLIVFSNKYGSRLLVCIQWKCKQSNSSYKLKRLQTTCLYPKEMLITKF